MSAMDPHAIIRITQERLAPLARRIDEDGVWARDIMVDYADAGAFATHLHATPTSPQVDLTQAYQAIEIASGECLSTGFCLWCQSAAGWVIAQSDNTDMRAQWLPSIASGAVMAGPGLSNCMKTLAGTDTIRLHADRVQGGWRVKGVLPWVSNIDAGSVIVTAIETTDPTPRRLCVALPMDTPGVTLQPNHAFLSMAGTATAAVRLGDVIIPETQVLADPLAPFVARFRPGFLVLQSAMAVGLIRDCVAMMLTNRTVVGDINRFLPQQPEDIASALAPLTRELDALCQNAWRAGPDITRRVLSTRLAVAELAMTAAQAALLHAGARGFVSNGREQRRLREAYFLGIVTPSTRLLRKLLA